MLPGWLRNTTRQGILATPDSTYEWRRKGEHVTNQMKLPLARLNVSVGVANLAPTKSDAALAPLLSAARDLLAPPPALVAIGA